MSLKKVGSLLLLCLFFLGCTGKNQELERVRDFRAELLAGMGCSFEAVITADYQDALYTFGVSCRSDENGGMTFEVTQPETISGISGRIDAQGGKLTFDDEVLAFELMADGQLTPVSAPWLLMSTLRGGYMVSAGHDNGGTRLTIHDSYAQDALQLDVWLNNDDLPKYCEILWQGRRVLSLHIKDFAFV